MRVLGIILMGVAAFLLVLAASLRFFALPALAKAPLSPGESTGGVTKTEQAGIAYKFFDVSTLSERTDVPVTATRYTRGDVPGSQEPAALAQDVAIYDTFQRVEDNAGTLLTASTARYAFNRVTSELVNCCGANDNEEEVNFSGIAPLKFPMFTQAKDYPYFDGSIGAPVTAKYSGVETIEGLEVYVYKVAEGPLQTGEREVPGELVGATDPVYVAPQFYTIDLTLWVEPTTGAIVKGLSIQKQTLRGPAGTDALTIVEAEIGTTPDEVKRGVDFASSNANLIKLLGSTVPLVGLIVGIVLLVAGILLVVTASRRSRA